MKPGSTAAIAILSFLWMPGQVKAAGFIEPYQDDENALSFNLQDLNGRSHRLEEYRGKVVLVNFWASWCAPCIREMPGIQRLSNIMDGPPFDVVAISVSEHRNTVQRTVQRQKLNFTVLLDPDSATFNEWQASMLPTSYLVDATGKIHYKAQGPLEWDEGGLVSIIESLMPGQP